MAKLHDMTPLEERYARWRRSQTTADLVELLKVANPVLAASIKSYVGYDDPAARSHAKLLALKALRKYDQNAGTKLQTYLMTQLQPLRRFAARRRSLLKTPEAVQYELARLNQASTELQNTLARDPSDLELADHSGISTKRIAKLRRYRADVLPESALVDASGGAAQPSVYSPGSDAWVDYVYHELTPTDRKIFEWRTGYNGVKKLQAQQIAKKLGVSAGAVSQRTSKIADRLAQGMKFKEAL